MEHLTRTFSERLFAAFFNWLDVNKETIGKWHADLYKRGKEAEANCNTMMKIMGDALWMFNMVSNLGVAAGVSPEKVDIQDLAPDIDVAATKRLLTLVQASLNLQGLPIEILKQEVPIISSKKFSLKMLTEQRELHGATSDRIDTKTDNTA